MEAVRRYVSRWPLWDLPWRLRMLVAGVITAYCAAIAAAVPVTRVQPGQLRLFAVLLAGSAAAVEVTRRMGEPRGVVRDVYAIWDLPCAVLLPPLFALLAPIPRTILTQARVRRGLVYRRAYSAAAVGLAYAAASLVFRTAAPQLGLAANAGNGGRAVLWTLLAAGCGLVRLVANDSLTLTAVKAYAPETRLWPEIVSGEALYGNVAELSLGTLAAFAASRSTLTVLYAIPLVISLQRSLRHAQLVSETRTDGKTGLLNDRTWRREAASEVARAVRTRKPVTVGIADIDHFKAVNDTCGHLAGDAVLVAIGAAMKALLRDYDIVGRVGGEEFAFILPDTPPSEAIEVAERLRKKIPLIAVASPDSASPAPPRVTVSIGLSAEDRPQWELDRYYALADAALYAAKAHGRDCVWVARAADPRPLPAAALQVAADRGDRDTAIARR
jgi:diguanylate cyclase (GGDEF)-like protein